MINRYEVRRCNGRVFCAYEPRPEVPEGTAGEVRHYTKPMVGVIEVSGRWAGTKFVIPREQFEAGDLLAGYQSPPDRGPSDRKLSGVGYEG